MANKDQSLDERCRRCGHTKAAHELPSINVCSQFLPSAETATAACHDDALPSKTVTVLTAAKIAELTTKFPNLGIDTFVHERDYNQAENSRVGLQQRLERLQRERDKYFGDWAELSQDDGKKDREIERLKTQNKNLLDTVASKQAKLDHQEKYWAQFNHYPKGIIPPAPTTCCEQTYENGKGDGFLEREELREKIAALTRERDCARRCLEMCQEQQRASANQATQVSNSKTNELKKYYAEIVGIDGAECEAMSPTRWAIDKIERLQRESAELIHDNERLMKSLTAEVNADEMSPQASKLNFIWSWDANANTWRLSTTEMGDGLVAGYDHLAGYYERRLIEEIERQREEIAKYKAWSQSCDPSPAIQATIAELDAWTPSSAGDEWLRVHCLGLLRGQLPAVETAAPQTDHGVNLAKAVENYLKAHDILSGVQSADKATGQNDANDGGIQDTANDTWRAMRLAFHEYRKHSPEKTATACSCPSHLCMQAAGALAEGFVCRNAVKGEAGRTAALATFTEYFVRNYPGPTTIISDPTWHAPKIFRAALHAIKTEMLGGAQSVSLTEPEGEHRTVTPAVKAPAECPNCEQKYDKDGRCPCVSENAAPKRQPPREDQTKPDALVRCAFCDTQVINGEAFSYARSCCEAGQKFDMSNGIPVNGDAG